MFYVAVTGGIRLRDNERGWLGASECQTRIRARTRAENKDIDQFIGGLLDLILPLIRWKLYSHWAFRRSLVPPPLARALLAIYPVPRQSAQNPFSVAQFHEIMTHMYQLKAEGRAGGSSFMKAPLRRPEMRGNKERSPGERRLSLKSIYSSNHFTPSLLLLPGERTLKKSLNKGIKHGDAAASASAASTWAR